jgi:hypothetical protein
MRYLALNVQEANGVSTEPTAAEDNEEPSWVVLCYGSQSGGSVANSIWMEQPCGVAVSRER